MTVKQRLTRSYIYMFLVPLLIAALLLILGVGIALFSLETKYMPRLGLTLWKMHATLEQYETTFSSLEIFIWTYLGAVGMALLLTICFTNFFLTRSLFRHISAPLDELVAGVERIQGGNLDEPIAYDGNDEFKAACDAVDLMAAKLKAALDDEQRAWALQNRYRLLSQMEGYCNTTGCLREYMLRYFGDEAAAEHAAAAGAGATATDEAEGCGNCSNCLTQFEVEDVTDMARAAVRYVATRPMRFGKSLIADVLHGGNTERIRQMHLDEDRGYGELSSESVGRIKDIIGQLCGRGYLATSQGQYPVVGLGPRAAEVEDEAFAFTVKRRASKRKASARARRAVDLLREEAELDQRPRVGDDAELFERLRALRKEISTELEMAPYMVFSDKALRGLCRLRPQTRDELIQVNGIGEKKADAFGEQFMAAIEEFESEHARDGA